MLAEDEVTDEYVITETDYATNPYKLEETFPYKDAKSNYPVK